MAEETDLENKLKQNNNGPVQGRDLLAIQR